MADQDFVIDVILNARDNLSGALRDAVGDVEKFDKQFKELNKSQQEESRRTADVYSESLAEMSKRTRELTDNQAKLLESNIKSAKAARELEQATRAQAKAIKDGNLSRVESIALSARVKTAEENLTKSIENQTKAQTRSLQQIAAKVKANSQYAESLNLVNRRQREAADIAIKEHNREIQAKTRADQEYMRQKGAAFAQARRLSQLNQQLQRDEARLAKSRGDEKLNIELEMGAARGQAERIREELNAIIGRVEAEVALDESKLTDDAKRIIALKEYLGRPIHIPVEYDRSAFEEIIQLGKKTRDNFHETAQKIAAFDNVLRGLAAVAVIFSLNSIVLGAGAAAGALAALASSAMTAGAALGGALAAGAAQAVPVLGLITAAVGRVAAVMQSVKQQNLLDQQQSYAGTRATNQLANAQDTLADAHRRVGEAQQRVIDARREAIRQLQDLILAEKQAELAARGATLSQEEAQAALRRAIREGDVSSVSRAQLGVDEADFNATRAGVNLSRARADASQARRGGVEGMEGVQNAKEALKDAERGAERARRSLAQTGPEMTAAAGKLNFLMAQLSGAERELMRTLMRLQDAWRVFSQEATEPLIRAFTRGTNRVIELLGSPRIIGAARDLSQSMADQFDRFFSHATSDRQINRWLRFAKEAGKNLKPLTDIAINISDAFMNIAEAASPAFREILDWVAELTGAFAAWTSSVDAQKRALGGLSLKQFFDVGVEHLQAWMTFLGAFGNLFLAIAGSGGGAEAGLGLIERMTDSINGLAESIRDPTSEAHKFFQELWRITDLVADQLGPIFRAIGIQLVRVFGADAEGALTGMTTILTQVMIPAFGDFLIVLGKIVNGIGYLVRELGPLGPALSKLFTILFLVTGVVGRLYTLGAPVVKLIGGIMGIFISRTPLATKAVQGLSAALLALSTRVLGMGALGAGLGAALGGIGAALGGSRIGRRGTAPAPLPRPGMAPVVAAPAGGAGRMARFGGLGGAGLAIGGYMAGNAIGGQGGSIVGGAATGAGVGMMAGPWGAAAGAAIGGVIGAVTGGNKGNLAAEAVAKMSKETQKLSSQNNVTGLRRLAAAADDMAKKFPGNSEALSKFADQARNAARAAEPLRRAIDKLRTQGIAKVKAADILDLNQLNQFTSNLNRMRQTGFTSFNDLRKNMEFNTKAINKGLVEGSDTWAKAMAENFGSGIESVRQAMRDGTITTDEGMREINRITKKQMSFARDNIDNLSHDAKVALASNLRDAVTVAINHAGGIEKATGDALKKIRRLLEQEYELYGLSPSQARRLARNRTTEGRENLNQWGGRDEGGRATGGFIGDQGERGRDRIRTVLGRGEAVLNYAHQKYIEPAVNAYYGHGLGDVFSRVRGYHAGGMDSPGFAGGYAGRTRHGRMVAIPGMGGEFVNAKILQSVLAMIRRFKLTVTDGFATSGHAPGGDHPKGLGVDFVPGPGGHWNLVDAAAAYANQNLGKIFRWVGYNGVPGHGRGHHLHLSWLGSGGAAVEGGSGNLAETIRKITAPQVAGRGGFRAAAQAGVNAVTAAANQKLKQVAESLMMSGGTEGMETPGVKTYRGDLNRKFPRHFLDNAAGFVRLTHQQVANLASRAGLPGDMFARIAKGESQYYPGVQQRNPGDGMIGYGLWQMTPNSWGAGSAALKKMMSLGGISEMFNPWKNALMAKFLYEHAGSKTPNTRGFPWYGTRYLAKGGFAGLPRFAAGGTVDGPDGSPVPIVAHAGEWVLNKIQQSKIAAALGTGVGKVRDYLGFTGGPTSFAGGGEVGSGLALSIPKLIEQERHERRMAALKGKHNEDERKAEKKRHDERMKAIKEEEKEERKKRDKLLPEQERRENIRRGVYELPTVSRRNIAGVRHEYGRATRAAATGLRAGGETGRGLFIRGMEAITGEGGILEQLSGQIESFSGRLKRSLALAQVGFKRVGNRLIATSPLTDAVAIAERTVNEHTLVGRQLKTQRNRELATLARVNREIAKIRKGGVTKEETDAYQKLMAQRGKLLDSLDESDEKIAQNEADKWTARIDAFQKRTEKALKAGQDSDLWAGLQSRIGAALGNTDIVKQASETQLNNLKERQRILGERVQRAIELAKADPRWQEEADRLGKEWIEVSGSIAEAQSRQLQEAVAAQEKAFSKQNAAFDWRGRAYDLMERGGNRLGAADQRIGLSRERVAAMNAQINALAGLQGQAAAQGNWGVFEDLGSKIQELQMAVQEQEQTTRDLIVAYRVTATELIKSRVEGTRSLYDAASTIVTSMSELSNGPQDTKRLVDIANRSGQALAQNAGEIGRNIADSINRSEFNATARDLLRQVSSAFSRGPSDFADILTALGPQLSNIQVDMGDTERNAFNQLIQSMIENTTATLDNSKRIKELSGQSNFQSFSTLAWRMFRTALLNGMGGLMPSYAGIPSAEIGGQIVGSGALVAHMGEEIRPANIVRKDFEPRSEGDVIINYKHPVQQADPVEIGKRVMWEKSRISR